MTEVPGALRRPGARWIALALVVGACAAAPPTRASAQSVGPPRGALVAVGGALQDTAIVRAFLDLAGGADAPIVVIPTAGEGDRYDDADPGLAPFHRLGAARLTILHTRDPATADTDEFVRPLREARGVWFTGGRPWRIADAYLSTRAEEEIRAVLERGGVVGGSSAGASILGSYLVRGDTETNQIVMGDHEVGLALLRGVAIDQHLLARNRHFDLIQVVAEHPELLGVGLDEDTAIVVRGDTFEVIGRGHVAIYDHGAMLDSGGLFYFLSPGDTFDLVERRAYREAGTLEPLPRVERRPWPGSP